MNRKYFINFSWIVIERICRVTISFLVTTYVIRYLGPHDYGMLSFAVSFVAFFSVFTTLGLDNILVRNLVRSPSMESLLLGTGLALRAIGAIFGFMLVVGVLAFTKYDRQTNLLVIVVASGMLLGPMGIIEPLFQSKVKARFPALSKLWAMVTVSVLRLALIALNATVRQFAWLLVVEKTIFNGALCFYYFKNRTHRLKWQFRLSLAKELLRDSWPLIFSGLVVMVYMRIDQVMIREMLGAEPLGYYAAAVFLAEGWYFLGTAVSSTLLPFIVQSRGKNQRIYYARLQQYYQIMVWMALSIAIPVHFQADWLISLLYGPAFSPAAGVLRINIWTGVFVFLGLASTSWLVAENLQFISLIRSIAGALLNILMNLILIPVIGILGAAIATLCSQILASYVAYAFSKTTFNNFIMQTKAFIPPFRLIRRIVSSKSLMP